MTSPTSVALLRKTALSPGERYAEGLVVIRPPPLVSTNVWVTAAAGIGSSWKTTVSKLGGSGHQLLPATCCTVAHATSAASSASAVGGAAAGAAPALLVARASRRRASTIRRMREAAG